MKKHVTQRRLLSVGVVALLVVAAMPGLMSSLEAAPRHQASAWFKHVAAFYRRAPIVRTVLRGDTPAVIPQNLLTPDHAGLLASHQVDGPFTTAGNGFFTELGTNGRTCFTCHQPQAGWAMNPSSARAIFYATRGRDPLFAPVDGTNCDVEPHNSLRARAIASSQLLTKGNIRIALGVPPGAEFQVRVLRDPYGCARETVDGADVLSVYRRVLASTNLMLNPTIDLLGDFAVSAQGPIMWDEREPSLEQQFIDATLGHAQATREPSEDMIESGVAFELRLLTAQVSYVRAGRLDTDGALGGPTNLANPLIGGAPFGSPFPSFDFVAPFNIFNGWVGSPRAARASINRGQTIFNSRIFLMTGVSGFNDVLGPPTDPDGAPFAAGTCGTCHNGVNMGHDVVPGPRHIGVADNSVTDALGRQGSVNALPATADQPLFSFLCPVDSIPFFSNPVTVDGQTYDEFETSDPGRALITGKCADLGKFKVPRLRGLAARAPYFHGGNADTLEDVVNFYDTRFSIGLTKLDKEDLVNFLNSL
jgi:hypothetical protein